MFSVVWFTVPVACLFVLPVLFWLAPKAGLVYTFWRFVFLKYIAYIVIVRRRSWNWTNVSLLHVLLFLLFLGTNCLILSVAKDVSDAMIRSGALASINLIPLFLGGRTNWVMDKLGIPLHVYYLAHHWIARIAILEGIVHVVLAVVRDGRQVFTPLRIAVSPLPGAQVLAENIGKLSVVLLGIPLLSIFPMRRAAFEVFWMLHLLLALFLGAGLVWHLIPGELTMYYPITALGLWVISFVIRVLRMMFHNFGKYSRPFPAHITKYRLPIRPRSHSDTLPETKVVLVKIELELKRPIAIKPGQYFYLNTSGRTVLQLHPFVITWWNDAPVTSGDLAITGPTKARSLTFLIQPRKGFTKRLSKKFNLEHMRIDGPYGQDLRLERYDTVLLVGKGIGIAGLLSYAKQLITWQAQRTKIVNTRKLDLYWELDENYQEKWVGHYLKELQEKNSELSSPILQIWCYFPENLTSEPAITLNPDVDDYRYFYPSSEMFTKLEDAVKEVCGKALGKGIVVACGVPDFIEEMRNATWSTMCKENVTEFVETEYQPTAAPQPTPASHPDEEIQLQDIKPLVISGPLPHARASNAQVKTVTKLEDIKEESHGGSEVTVASFV